MTRLVKEGHSFCGVEAIFNTVAFGELDDKDCGIDVALFTRGQVFENTLRMVVNALEDGATISELKRISDEVTRRLDPNGRLRVGDMGT